MVSVWRATMKTLMWMKYKKLYFSLAFILLSTAVIMSPLPYQLTESFRFASLIKIPVAVRKYELPDDFSSVLKVLSSPDKDIILSFIDLGVYSVAINFWESSLLKHSITSYLFLSTSKAACNKLMYQNINCFVYQVSKNLASNHSSSYGTKEFKDKMNSRLEMIKEALSLGYNVLHSDVDIIFTSSPLQQVIKECDFKCDIAALVDYNVLNAGFVYSRPTNISLQLYEKICQIVNKTKLDDQQALARATAELKAVIKVTRLSKALFQCGLIFYEQGSRKYADTANKSASLVIHNNFIVTVPAKIYRFKEMLQWCYDGNGYYSSADRRYITYDNPLYVLPDLRKSWEEELRALQNAFAIGILLNRTVILPKFHCGAANKECTLLSRLKIAKLDSEFHESYREHLFLRHPKVPQFVNESLSKLTLIVNGHYSSVTSNKPETILIPKAPLEGATSNEILKWLGNSKESVLRFSHLFGAFSKFSNVAVQNAFESRCKRAFVPGRYKQL